MGQKTHPYGFRLGYNKPWKSRWYADRDYADLLHEDVKLRKELKERLKSAGVSSIDIERAANKLVVRIATARPGIIIGRKGAEIARKEWYLQGRLPLQTLRADIDFGTAEANTTYGVIGVKCWIYQGENIPKRNKRENDKPEAIAAA